jgi:hypothetical protein
MSPKLKPLILPQLVEERRKLEVQHNNTDADLSYVYYTTNSSSSDVASPVTPTFSSRGHLRYSSSTSSLELAPICTESPSSPTQSAHKSGKRLLPDVQEEPVEPENEDTIISNQFELYDCLCKVSPAARVILVGELTRRTCLGDEPCIHRESSDMIHSAVGPDYDIDYDIGFLSDTDFTIHKKRRNGPDSSLSGFATRFGSRFPNLSRWKSTKRAHLTASPTTELSFEHALPVLPVSRAASSRSSSLSAPSRGPLDRSNEPPLPTTPALSFWESSESINLPAAIDIEKANTGRPSLERDRALATTPLLPPLLIDSTNQLPQQSPLQSPAVAPSSAATEVQSPAPSHTHQPSHSLSTKLSVSSFRPSPTSPELPIPLPSILQDHDEWSDRLGHANFTIFPQPYHPETANMEALRKLRADWDAARVNYTKHIVRTGENYGQTSKIYGLTEAKWAEIEKSWRTIHEETMERILAVSNANIQQTDTSTSRSRSRGRGRGRSGSGSAAIMGKPPTDDIFAGMQWNRLEDGAPAAVPRMLYAEGKFPSRGDEDIVGPMVREAVMIRAKSEERKGSSFWRSLAGKVGLRK